MEVLEQQSTHTQKSEKLPIVLIHGLHQTHWIMKPMSILYEKAGYKTYSFNYSSLMESIDQHSKRLNDWLINNVQAEKFHLVGHSLGGLVIRDFITRYPQWVENNRVDRIVTLGTPHLGSTTADYIKRILPIAIGKSYKGALDGSMNELNNDICLGVIAGNKATGVGTPFLSYHTKTNKLNEEFKAHDGTVYVFETKLAHARDHIVLPVTHTGMLVDKTVATQSMFFLEHGYFNRIHS